MASPREHVEEIRRKKFSIGGEENPLTEDLHQAVKNLSAELYAKDVHFLMELIQNAEDNEYAEGVDPSLEFVITSKDITATGAPATLVIFNNETGFSPKNIDSICSVGRSTKKGHRKKGYIGEKGIGFKSVFLITSTPYIFSNGYQIRFNEDPCEHCGLGYVVPEWVHQNPTLSEIQQIYSSSSSSTLLPTTTLVLPLKPDKVNAVTRQLSSVRPEIILFLSKIKRLSVSWGSAVSISKETEYVQRKNIDAESFTLHLSGGSAGQRSFYMWRQRFPVPPECRVERRLGVDEWALTLAFPLGGGSDSDSSSPGVYAFLPTEMVTNFPFLIQADFLLSSSRETIMLDSPWNRGILQRVPAAFVAAFKVMATGNPDAPLWTLPRLFGLLPVEASRYPELNAVRAAIRDRMGEEHVVPSEAASTEQRLFHRPRDVGRLKPGFWTVLSRARREGLSLSGLSSHGSFILASCFDSEEHDGVLGFLGVKEVESEWYGKCVRGSGLVEGLSEDGYLELVAFLAEHWSAEFSSTGLRNIPLIKYEDVSGKVSLSSVAELAQSRERSVFQSRCPKEVSWLIKWNRELGCPGNRFFVPGATQRAIRSSSNEAYLGRWLQSHASIGVVDVPGFAELLCCSLRERKLFVLFVHFLYHSMSKDFLSERRAGELCRKMPVVDNYGNVVTSRTGVLVPAKGSKWAGLVGSNVWRDQVYVELSGDYLSPGRLGGSVITNEGELAGFLRDQAGAEDIPSIPPPNARIAAANSPLTKANALLLLEWVRSVRSRGIRFAGQFSASLSEGNWLRVSLKGCPGFRPPSESFLLGSSKSVSGSWVSLLQRGSVLVDIPLVDQSYYGDEIKGYGNELRALGVKSEYSEACEFIGNRLMSLADSGNLTRENVLSILGFIKFLRSQCLSPKEFVDKIRDGRWLRTCLGDKSPPESVWFDETWRVASQICNIPFVDRDHYGREINGYKAELELLGVVVSSSARHQFLANCLKSPSGLARLSSDGFLLLLECMRFSSLSNQIRRALTGTQCLKTNYGYRSPGGSVLCDPTWGCLLKIFDGVPLIDLSFYHGDAIFSFKKQLKQLGVVVDFEQAVKEFTRCFRDRASSRSVSKENVMSLLSAYRRLKQTFFFPSDLNDLKDCIRDLKWLRTQHCDYYRSPKECILYSSDWAAVSPIAHLPFIDDTDNWYGKSVHEYKKELKSMRVVVDFKSGVKFVASGLYFNNIESITRETALALLECVRILSEEKGYKFPEKFTENLSQPWLKTYVGYRPPNQSMLFDSKFAATGLTKKDGPFIDEEFYGPKLASYRETLAAIGVVVEVEKGCRLIAGQVDLQATLSKITRLYDYLGRFNWEPESESENKIWIPNGSQKGRWVRPEDCVVSDKSGLFSSQLIILDKYYEKNLFFFLHCFKVKPSPCTEDYCRLWKTWESSEGLVLTHDECCKFWGFIVKNWTSKSEKTLPKEFAKVPVKVKDSGSNGVVLMDKTDVFIADDLQLKDLFEERCSRQIFVWYPQPSPPSLSRTKLLAAFRKIGVRKISESVQREQEPSTAPIGTAIPSTDLIGRALAKLVLGFLASPGVEMEPEERHKALGDLLKLSVVETEEPISVCYDLALSSSGETLSVKANRTVRWERESSEIFTQKVDGSRGPGYLIERATYFSEAIAEGLLWENGDHIHELAELLKLAFLLGFDDKAVDFLMKSKNLQIFVEDDNFLSASFPSD